MADEGRDMRIIARFVVTVLCVVAVGVVAGMAGGCGTADGESAPRWERVLSAKVSGEQPVKVNLGVHQLGDRLRVAWALSGPEDPPVTLTLRIFDVDTGRGYGTTVTSHAGPGTLDRQDDQAMSVLLVPGEYRIFFSQRFLPALGPGYGITLTIWTMHSYTATPTP